MAISKPSWLRTWLDSLNWDILTWHVYVGDAIESAIDWAIGWLNWGILQAELAWNKAVAAWDKAVEVGKNAWNDLMKEADKLWANIDTWWSDLGEWWEGKKQDIGEWIDTAKEDVGEWWDSLKQDLGELHTAWDSFWENTWPQLIKDFNAWVVKVGNFFTVTLPGLASHKDVDKAIADDKLTWKDLWNFWGDFGKEVGVFFSDPEEWLLDKLEKMLARFW